MEILSRVPQIILIGLFVLAGLEIIFGLFLIIIALKNDIRRKKSPQ